MRPNDYPEFVYRGNGLTFEVYRDRVVVTKRKLLQQQQTTHPIAHIARVEIKGAPAQLHLIMDDGTGAAYRLAGHVVAARDAIVRSL